jgi:multidrug efflux pump subunit AcrA (membrane-fusion protein)
MYVLATLPYGRMEAALLVPDAAVGHDQAGSYLYVLSPDDVVERRAVTLGQLIADSLRIVASGLTAEERYVVDAGLKVRVGMKVDAQF